jgi:type IV secretory pathway TrbD component
VQMSEPLWTIRRRRARVSRRSLGGSKREGMMMDGQDVGAVALVVDAERELLALVAHESRVAKDVDRKTGGRRTGVRRIN